MLLLEGMGSSPPAYKIACITLRYYYNFAGHNWLISSRLADYGYINRIKLLLIQNKISILTGAF
jgi:hypothetical protein